MLARVARYGVPPDRCDDAVKAFLNSAQEIAAIDGFGRGYLLVDSETGATVTLTLWESHAAFETSATVAALARRRASRWDGSEVTLVSRACPRVAPCPWTAEKFTKLARTRHPCVRRTPVSS